MPTCASSSRTPSSASIPRLTPRSPAELDQPEHGRPDEDAGNDLAEHGGDAEPLRNFSGKPGRGEHDEEVEQQPRQVDGLHGTCAASAQGRDDRQGERHDFRVQPPAAPAHGDDGRRDPGARRRATMTESQRRTLRPSSPASRRSRSRSTTPAADVRPAAESTARSCGPSCTSTAPAVCSLAPCPTVEPLDFGSVNDVARPRGRSGSPPRVDSRVPSILLVEDDAPHRRVDRARADGPWLRRHGRRRRPRGLGEAVGRRPPRRRAARPRAAGHGRHRALSPSPCWPGAPIVVVSGNDRDERIVAALDVGADDYVVKPVAIDVLAARIAVQLRHVAATVTTVAAPALEVGDVRLDAAAHEVEAGGAPVALNVQQFRVLAVLMRNVGHAGALRRAGERPRRRHPRPGSQRPPGVGQPAPPATRDGPPAPGRRDGQAHRLPPGRSGRHRPVTRVRVGLARRPRRGRGGHAVLPRAR